MVRNRKIETISILLILSMLLQLIHPIVTLAFRDSSINIQDIEITVLDLDGNPLPDVEVELLKKETTEYKDADSYSTTTDSEGKASFVGVLIDPNGDYGLLAKGEIPSPEFEFVKDPVIWFTELPKQEGLIQVTLSLQDLNLHRLILQPFDENGQRPYGDMKYVIITGETVDGSNYTKIINTLEVFHMPIVLPDGQYRIEVYANSHFGQMPTYMMEKYISLPSEFPEDGILELGDSDLSLLSIELPMDKDDVKYYISAVSIHSKEREESPILYMSKDTKNPKIYLPQGDYRIVAALTGEKADDKWTYFLENDIRTISQGEINLSFDDNFNTLMTADIERVEKGETIDFSYSIEDSFGNKLIGKTQNLSIGPFREISQWSEEYPTLKILNSNNEEVYENVKGNNMSIFEEWNGWNPEENMVPQLDKNNTFFNSQYKVPQDAVGGIYTVKVDLGEGSHEDVSELNTFIVEGEEGELMPILDKLPSPTNLKELEIKGVASPDTYVELYYKYNEGEEILIETVKTEAVTGKFNVVFIVEEEGKYSFIAKTVKERKISSPITCIVDWSPVLEIKSVNWQAEWDMNNHIIPESRFLVSIVASKEKTATIIIEYETIYGEIRSQEIILEEEKHIDGKGNGRYNGRIIIPFNTSKIINLTAIIKQDDFETRKEAIGLPVSLSGSIDINIIADEDISNIKNGEISIWSNSKNFRRKINLDGSNIYSIDGIIPSDDYEIQLKIAQRLIAEENNIRIIGGDREQVNLSAFLLPGSLDIRVVDKDGEPINFIEVRVESADDGNILAVGYSGKDGWVRPWANLSSDKRIPIIKDRFQGERLRIVADGSRYYMEKYSSPRVMNTSLLSGEDEITMTMLDRPSAKLVGNVRIINGDILKEATVTAYTNIGGYEIENTTITDEYGNYELDIKAGKVRIVVTHRIAGSREFIIPNTIFEGENRNYDIDFQPEKKISINIKTKSFYDADHIFDPNLINSLIINLTNKGREGKSKNETAYVYGDLMAVAVPGAEPGDMVEVVVDGSKVGYNKEVITVTLDEDAWAAVDFQLIVNGRIQAELIDAYGSKLDEAYAQLYKVEDGQYKYISNYKANASSLIYTNSLETGKYAIAFHTWPISYSMDFSSILDFFQDEVTIIGDIEVKEGEIYNLGKVIIPKKEATGVFLFRENEGNNFRANTRESSPGQIITLTGNYKFYNDDIELRKTKFYLGIPKGTEYIEGSILIRAKNDTREPSFYMNKSTANIELFINPNVGVKGLEGTISYQVRVVENPELPNIGTRFLVEYNYLGETFTETIGEVNVNVPYVTIYAPPYIINRTVPLSGNAIKNSIVKIYDGSYYLGQVLAGNNGVWKTTVQLPDRGNPATHYLRAVIDKSFGEKISSEVSRVDFNLDRPQVVKIEFGHTDIFKKQIRMGYRFRYLSNQEKDHELDVYFDNTSRIYDLKIHSGDGTVIAEGDQITYYPLEHKYSARWLTPVVVDEIKVSYKLRKAPFDIRQYVPIEDDILLSGLPDLWRDARVLQSKSSYNQVSKAFENNSIILLSDGNTVINSNMRISDYTGVLPEGYSEDSLLPIAIIEEATIIGDEFRMSFILPGELIMEENDDVFNINSIATPTGVASKMGTKIVEIFGNKKVLKATEKGADLYDIFDTIKMAYGYKERSDKLGKLERILNRPCIDDVTKTYYKNEILGAQLSLGTSTYIKVVASGPFMVIGKVPGPGLIIKEAADKIIGELLENYLDSIVDEDIEDLDSKIRAFTKFGCPGEDEGDGSGASDLGSEMLGLAKPDPIILIDPSGYVYEGVEDNRIEGVTTTAYEKIDGEWTFWDASWFAQENPLVTDEVGWYQWDVPEGLWQVIYEKEGYEVARSEELPVPPPQLEVNIGLISLGPPTVEKIVSSEGEIYITFDKYMDVSTVQGNNIKVYGDELDENGNRIFVNGVIEALEQKPDPQNDSKSLSKTFIFVPEEELISGGIYTVWINSVVTNYAGRTMEEDIMENIKILGDIENYTVWERNPNTPVETDKVWNIEFSQSVKEMFINDKYFYVKDDKGRLVPVIVDSREDNHIITIEPLDKYISGKTYTLYIKKEVQNALGKTLTNSIKMEFEVH